MRSIFCSSLLLALAACSSPVADSAGPIDATSKVGISAAPTGKVLREVATTHNFSSTEKPDKFRLQLLGDDVLTAKAHFLIIGAAGDTLWSEFFPASALLSYDAPQPSDNVRRADILKRLDTFFEDKSFSATAINSSSTFDADYSANQQVWAEVKQRQAPGFGYVLGDENGRTLAYSPKLSKAAIVIHCC